MRLVHASTLDRQYSHYAHLGWRLRSRSLNDVRGGICLDGVWERVETGPE